MVTPSLSSSDFAALRAVNDALLDPLSHDTVDGWLLAVSARFQTLCHAQAGVAGFSFPGNSPRFVSREIGRNYLDQIAELLPVPGSPSTEDTGVEERLDGLRRHVSAVATTADLLEPGQLSVSDLEESPMYRDVAFPLGLPGCTLLLHSGASGEFILHASYPELVRRPFGAATHAIMAALLPAFAASVGALARLGNARQAVAVLLDALEDGAVVFDTAGRRVLLRNVAINALMQREPDSAGLERVILQAALAAAWPTGRPALTSGGSDPGALSRGWRSPSGIPYRLRAVRLPSGSLAQRESVLVLVQRVRPSIPDLPELMRRFGLTRREADVAHRLAYGQSDRQIAAALGLSAHTVRHHAEAIFVKVGVTSRKALALHLGFSSTF